MNIITIINSLNWGDLAFDPAAPIDEASATIGGKQNLDLQRNSRVGATFSRALDQHNAIRMSVSRGAYTAIGAEFNAFSFGYNYAWAH
jgi:hypothetical protein